MPVDADIHKVCKNGDFEELAVLLRLGVCPHMPGAKGRTPFHVAAASASTHCICLLLSHEADFYALDNLNRSILHFAASGARTNKDTTCLEYLLGFSEVRKLINRQSASGCTPLHFASGDELVCKLLIEAGADASISDADGQLAMTSAPVPLGLRLSTAAPSSVTGVAKLVLRRASSFSRRAKSVNTTNCE